MSLLTAGAQKDVVRRVETQHIWTVIDAEEIKVFLGLVMQAAIVRSREVLVRELFTDKNANPVY